MASPEQALGCLRPIPRVGDHYRRNHPDAMSGSGCGMQKCTHNLSFTAPIGPSADPSCP